MNPMPLALAWPDLALRLLLATVAGTLIGLNRGESGNAAGLRTTLLVCLAACIAMIQVNVLLMQHGKPYDSFVMLDLMRLPLGILSGVGFIGAGSILHRDGLVQGVTTAATMWFVTVIGLCAGGGQYALAVAGTVLGLLVLKTFAHVERWLPRNADDRAGGERERRSGRRIARCAGRRDLVAGAGVVVRSRAAAPARCARAGKPHRTEWAATADRIHAR